MAHGRYYIVDKGLGVQLALALMLCLLQVSCGEEENIEYPNVNEGPVFRALESAAIELEVPLSVLMAVSYVETRWEMLNGQPSQSRAHDSLAWGVMGLSEGRNLERAATAIGSTQDDVRYALEENVRAAAALLAIIASNTLGSDYAAVAKLGDYRDLLADFAGLGDIETTISYVEEVVDVMRHGAGRMLSTGEIVDLQGEGHAVDQRGF